MSASKVNRRLISTSGQQSRMIFDLEKIRVVSVVEGGEIAVSD